MGRVINPDNPGKHRNQLMRTSAEILRRLSQKQNVDDDVRDMVAMLVFCFRDIDEGIDQSAQAWEKRDYWVKAEEFRQRWQWAGQMADNLSSIVLCDRWDLLPPTMVKLFPYFADIKITKFTRDENLWKGAYERLVRERPQIID